MTIHTKMMLYVEHESFSDFRPYETGIFIAFRFLIDYNDITLSAEDVDEAESSTTLKRTQRRCRTRCLCTARALPGYLYIERSQTTYLDESLLPKPSL